MGDSAVTVNIRCSNGSKFAVETALDVTVEALKAAIADRAEVPAGQQRLIYKGRILKDDQTLASYGVESDHTIHLVRGFAQPAPANTGAVSLGASGNAESNARGSGAEVLGATPFPGLGLNGLGTAGSSGLFGAGFHELDQVQQQLTQNQNIMWDLMNLPVIQNMMTNPDLMRNLIMNDPQMREIIDRNPQLGHALNDPNTLRQTVEAAWSGLRTAVSSGLFGAGFHELDQVQQQQLTQNPNIMRDLMNLPVIQNMTNNPDLIRSLIMNNPQMREIIDRNPELGHVLNDPNTLRQTLEAARNPEIMREMMRNTDRAMSNIEASPEGFNMLRRMYETVQEPFLNATTMAGGTRSNPFAALLGNPGTTQSQNSSTTGSEPTNASPAPNTNPLPNPWGNAGGTPASNTRSTASAATTPAIGIPELERMAGGMPDPSLLTQVMQNPVLTQMMQSLLSDPQYMNQILNWNPQLRAAMNSNPQLREMMQNPEFLSQLTSPETLQHPMSSQSLFSQFGRQQSNQGQNQTDGGAGTGMPSMDFLMNMFSGLGAGGLGVPNPSNLPPEELYATQLSQLQEMGFFDTQENIRALSATAGNVNAAVERLLGNPGR